ncbi:MAG: hypothetical protein ACR2QC_02280 [Gammaproteobacteria bacterium]
MTANDEEYFLVRNESGADLVYLQSDARIFYPRDTRFPPLPLANLQADVTVPDGTQGLLIFENLPPEYVSRAIGTGTQTFLYFSEPSAALTCGTGMILNALQNDCVDSPSSGNDGNGNDGNPGVGGASSGDGNARDLAVIGLGVGVVGFMAAYLSGGDFSLFHFAPNIGYSATENGYAYNVGGRADFRKDNWHLYYAAGQENTNGEFGDFRYESGGEYSADLWTAAFSETIQGETADYDFSLSADYHGGIWKISPTYRLHSHFADEEFDTQNSLNLQGELLWNRWTIRPSAGFRWESADEFGDNVRFNLSAVRRF